MAGPYYEVQAIAWEDFDVDTGVKIQQYDESCSMTRCIALRPSVAQSCPCTMGCGDAYYKDFDLRASDPLSCHIGVWCCHFEPMSSRPKCVCNCMQPQVKGLFRAQIISKSNRVTWEYIQGSSSGGPMGGGTPGRWIKNEEKALIELIGLADSPEDLMAALRAGAEQAASSASIEAQPSRELYNATLQNGAVVREDLFKPLALRAQQMDRSF